MTLRHKFKAQRTERGGLSFPSKAEAEYYDQLKLAEDAGDLIMFLRQPRFDLPGRITYSADFLEFWADGTVVVTDVKGYMTKEFIARKKMVEELYPITINVVRKVGKDVTSTR